MEQKMDSTTPPDISEFETHLEAFIREVDRKTDGPLSDLCKIFEESKKSFIEAASEYNTYELAMNTRLPPRQSP